MCKWTVPALLIFLVGCASIFSGKNQNIPVFSKPEGAKVTVYNMSKIKVWEGTTPCYITQSKEVLLDGFVVIEKEGYKRIEIPLGSKIEPWCWGNCLFLTGVIIAAPIDILSGSWKKTSVTKLDLILESSSAYYFDKARFKVIVRESGNACEMLVEEL